jgi:hypothetical protein
MALAVAGAPKFNPIPYSHSKEASQQKLEESDEE